MVKFSLINVSKEADGFVRGGWLQNHIGTLESATARAIATEGTNSNKIDVAVVEEVNSSVPIMQHWRGLQRLDVSRINVERSVVA